jgi:hypothetical protein
MVEWDGDMGFTLSFHFHLLRFLFFFFFFFFFHLWYLLRLRGEWVLFALRREKWGMGNGERFQWVSRHGAKGLDLRTKYYEMQ